MSTQRYGRSGRCLASAILALLAITGATTAHAATLCVKPGGGGSCSSTISSALTAAAAGDTIRVAAGTYVESLLINKSVVLQGGWNDTFTNQDPVAFVTTVSCPAAWNFSVVWISSTAATLEGFTITGGHADLGGNHGGGLRVTGGANAVVRRNRITGNTSYLLGGGVWVQASTVRLEANRIENNTATYDGASGGGAEFENSQVTVVSNVIANNTITGASLGGGIACDTCSGVLASNTFVANAQQGIVNNYGGTLTLTDNIIKGHAVGAELRGLGTITSATFNDFFGNTTNTVGFTLDSTNLFVDPLLTTDFHLVAGSPMRDAGSRSTPANIDLDGEPRFMAGPSGFFKVDIGADETTGASQHVVDLDTGGADFTFIGPGGSASETNGQNNWIGYAALAADVNGDGKADLVVSAEDWTIDKDNPPRAAGRLFGLPHFGARLTGTVDLLTAPPANLLTVLSTYNLQHVGADLVSADVTGDGLRDLIAGSYEDDNAGGGTVFPTAFVLQGGASLAGTYPLGPASPPRFALKAPGQDFLAFAKQNALAAGDVNGDGVADLVVGDALADHGAIAATGAIFVMFGGPGLSGTRDLAATPADLTIYGSSAGDKLGTVALGRVDAGGQADLVARTDTTAYVFLGPLAGGTLTTATANITITGLQAPFDSSGQVLVGDLTGDGQDDLVLASGADLYLVPGPLVNGDVFNVATRAVVILAGAKARSLALADVVGDSRPDLIVGAPSLKQVLVVQGPIGATGTVPAADVAATVVRSFVGRNLGWDVAAGDLDGDGRPDLIASSWQLDITSHPANFEDAGAVYVLYSDRPADLAVTNTDGQATAVPGQPITYTIVASNAGPNVANGATVTDTVPATITGASWTCVGAGGGTCAPAGTGSISDTVNLPVGGSVTYALTGIINPGATGGLSNTATVTAPGGVSDPVPANNAATDTDTLTPQANLSITKTDGQANAVPGSPITYMIVASNAGPSAATGATVADTVPASVTGVTWTCVGAGGGTCAPSGAVSINDTVNLPVEGTVTYTLTGTVSPLATGNLSNTATVTAPGGVTDPSLANNSATDTDTLNPEANLSITKTDGQAAAVPGTPVTYTIVASNAGPSVANGATVVDTVPAAITGATWTCAVAGGGTCAAIGSGNINDTVNLPVGGTVTYTLTGTISASAWGSLTNTATVTAPSGITDPNPANNSATDTDTLPGVDYFTLAPCRVVDTRGGAPIGGPALQGQETRPFAVAGYCGIPLTAKALSINVTVTQSSAPGNVRLFPAGQPVATASSINYAAGQTRANNAVITLNTLGEMAAFVGQPTGTTVHLIIDVNGYFE